MGALEVVAMSNNNHIERVVVCDTDGGNLQMGEKVKRIKLELFWSSSGKGKKKNKKKEENSFNFFPQ